MKIKILKNSRQLEIPEYATMDELKAILCKWAPYVANDENKTAYTLHKKPIFGNFAGIDDLFSKFFGSK